VQVQTLRDRNLVSTQLLPKGALFFCMALCNTLLDAAKDTLVITGGGGVQQLPFLVTYIVFPCSVLFLLAFTSVSSRYSRGHTFDLVIAAFATFFAVFTFVLYPLRHVLHPTEAAALLAAALPPGLSGAVACFRDWTFSLFYVASELWGDVVLSLLFWGLANETTSLRDAPLLYPLFGIGANMAQASAGLCLKLLATCAHATGRLGDAAWAFQLRALCLIIVATCAGIVALHAHIVRVADATGTTMALPPPPPPPPPPPEEPGAARSRRRKSGDSPSLAASLATVTSSGHIQALAMCAVAQGVATTLHEFAWKDHLRQLVPTPDAYSAAMGDVATATGVLSMALMLLSPVLFARLKWHGAASASPRILLFGGGLFFAAAVARSQLLPAALGPGLLQPLVVLGSLLFVFSRASKYALWKPSEEIIYMSLDYASRTRGKAAIDVVANQVGKSGGSLFNQALLLGCGGSLPAALPLMSVAFMACVVNWLGAVASLERWRHKPVGPPAGEAPSGEDARGRDGAVGNAA
jgi:AAA family ATP:ADP antiporter